MKLQWRSGVKAADQQAGKRNAYFEEYISVRNNFRKGTEMQRERE